MIIKNNTLYIIATPIGNLADITYRAIYLLKACNVILCEDTRVAYKLLSKYNIDLTNKKLIVHNKDNENEDEFLKILHIIRDDKIVAFISDAGTPCISDPGGALSNFLMQKNIEIDFLPGPCAVISAFVLSGFESKQFTFLGFVPKTTENKIKFFERIKAIELSLYDNHNLLNLTYESSSYEPNLENLTDTQNLENLTDIQEETEEIIDFQETNAQENKLALKLKKNSNIKNINVNINESTESKFNNQNSRNSYIFYDTKERLQGTLEALYAVLYNQEVAISREMTKMNQETIKARVSELIHDNFAKINHIKGELAIVISINTDLLVQSNVIEQLEDNIKQLLKKHFSIKDIAQIISNKYPVSKNQTYKIICSIKEQS